MIEVRIHGRGGQGAVIACHALAVAFFKEGSHVQSFPFFGFERRGAPVVAFVRVDDKPVRLRCQVYEPDHVIVFGAALMDVVDVTAGLKEGGWAIVNTGRTEGELVSSRFRLATVDATSIAAKHGLGTPTLRAVNTAMLGAFSGATGLVGMDALCQAVSMEEGLDPQTSLAALQDGFKMVKVRDGDR